MIVKLAAGSAMNIKESVLVGCLSAQWEGYTVNCGLARRPFVGGMVRLPIRIFKGS